MEKKRFIFDLDYTLMVGDHETEGKFFRDLFGVDGDNFLIKMVPILHEYESLYLRYDPEDLSKFLTNRTGLCFNKDIIYNWIDTFAMCDNKIEDGVVDTLEYLKKNNKSIVVLTNWFYKSQEMRLRNSGLLEYMDAVYAGDTILKPRKDAYLSARDHFSPSECLFIGDNLEKDYLGPRNYGMDSILYDKNDRYSEGFVKIKRMNEIENVIGGFYGK